LKRAIYAIDIGSTRSNRKRGIAFAWAQVYADKPDNVVAQQNIERLAAAIRSDLQSGFSVSLGFEAPLFIPVPSDAADLSRRRCGERNRSWSAPPGLAVATLAVHQVAWLLKNLADLKRKNLLSTNPEDWPPKDNSQILYCWEAFVSGEGHSEDHLRDAATAAKYFLDHETSLLSVNAVSANVALSLFHAAGIWAGWLDEVQSLNKQLLVLRPPKPYLGAIL
jgi:hypothetical protein